MAAERERRREDGSVARASETETARRELWLCCPFHQNITNGHSFGPFYRALIFINNDINNTRRLFRGLAHYPAGS